MSYLKAQDSEDASGAATANGGEPQVLQFDSFTDAKAFFAEERISRAGGADPQTAELIRSVCV